MADPKKDGWDKPVQPKKDWSKAGAGEVAVSAAKNLGPSMGKAVNDTLDPVMAIANPMKWQKTYRAGKQALTDYQASSKSAGDPMAPIAHAAKGIVGYYKQRYGTVPGIKEAVATDPAGVALDASTGIDVARLPFALAKAIPGVVGRGAGKIDSALATAEKATNPLYVAAKGVEKAAGDSRKVAMIAPVDTSGELTTYAKMAVKQAFPDGQIGAAELADPKFKNILVATMKKKGSTPEAAREAVLAYHGAPTPRSAVTGKRPPAAAAQKSAEMRADAKTKIGASRDALKDSQTSLGAELEKAQIAAHNDMTTRYQSAFNQPGSFYPEQFVKSLPDSIEKSLKGKQFSAPGELAADLHSEAAKAYDYLTDRVGRLSSRDELTGANLERTRQKLNDIMASADGTDKSAVRAIIEGFDDHIQNLAQNGAFVGGDGPKMAADMKDARKAFRDYSDKFANTSNDTHAVIAKAVKQFAADQTKDASGLIVAPAASGSAQAAEGILAGRLINPRTLAIHPGAEKLSGELERILGAPEPVSDFLRQSAFSGEHDPQKLYGFLEHPLSNKALTPEQKTQAKLIGAAEGVLSDAKPPSGPMNEFVQEASELGKMATAGAMGHVLGGPYGAATGMVGEKGLSIGKNALDRTLERRGAARSPLATGLGAIEGAGRSAADVSRLAPIIHSMDMQPKPEEPELEVEQPTDVVEAAPSAEWDPPVNEDAQPVVVEPARVERAAGGRTEGKSCEELVGALMRRAKVARREVNEITEPLLKQPDEAIVKALDVAQQSI